MVESHTYCPNIVEEVVPVYFLLHIFCATTTVPVDIKIAAKMLFEDLVNINSLRPRDPYMRH